MKIKHPFNFLIGIFCAMFLCIGIVIGRDTTDLIIKGIISALNIIFAFME